MWLVSRVGNAQATCNLHIQLANETCLDGDRVWLEEWDALKMLRGNPTSEAIMNTNKV